MAYNDVLSIVALSFALGPAYPREPRRRRNDGPPAPAQPTTHIRVKVAAMPDSAVRMVVRVLRERGYIVRDSMSQSPIGDCYIAGVGKVRVRADIRADSVGAVVQLSGDRRRIYRLFTLSAISSDSVVIANDVGGARNSQAWYELVAIGEELSGTAAPSEARTSP